MAEEETTVLHTLLELLVVVTLVNVSITVSTSLLEDILLDVFQHILYALNDTVEAYVLLLQGITTHNLDGVVLQVTTTHSETYRNTLQLIVSELEARTLCRVVIILHGDAQLAELVDDNDTIMMNAGTTLTYVLRALRRKKNISIVTNSIRNANEINQYPSFNVTLLGGQIDPRYQFTYGNDTIRQLKTYHANKCILSLDGVSALSGLSLYYTNEELTIVSMMKLSDTVIVAADASKIGKTTFTTVSDISAVDILVTNRAEEKAKEIELLKKEGIRVYETE